MFKSTKSDAVPPMSQIPNTNIEPGQRWPTACLFRLSCSLHLHSPTPPALPLSTLLQWRSRRRGGEGLCASVPLGKIAQSSNKGSKVTLNDVKQDVLLQFYTCSMNSLLLLLLLPPLSPSSFPPSPLSPFLPPPLFSSIF